MARMSKTPWSKQSEGQDRPKPDEHAAHKVAQRRLRRNVLAPWLILLASLLATFWAWRYSNARAREKVLDSFDREVDRSTTAIRDRLAAYEHVLYGTRSLFESDPAVSRKIFHDYVEGLQLSQRYPGIQAVEYVVHLTPEERAAHVRAVRKEGFPTFDVHPPGERAEYTSIVYVEPFNWRNQRAFGYDMLTEPVRRAALEYARDSGQTSISDKVRLVQETNKDVQAGFLMYLPLYRQGAPLETLEQRRAALLGYFCSPFRMNNFMDGVIRERSPLASFRIFAGLRASPEALLYASQSEPPKEVEKSGGVMRETEVRFGGQTWLLQFFSTPAFAAEIHERQNRLILPAGISLGLLLFGFTYSLARAESRASALLAAIQRGETELQQSEARFRSLFEEAPLGVYRVTVEGKFLLVNSALVRMLGYESEAEVLRLNIERDVYCDPEFRQRLVREYWGKKDFRDVEAEWKRQDGGHIIVRMNGRPGEDEAGRFPYFEVFAEDVTEQHELARQLQQSQKMEAIGQLAGGIAHDFNNLLAVILGQTELLLLQPDLAETVRKRAESVERSGKRAASLTKQLLAFSRRQIIEPKVFGISPAVQEAAKLLRPIIGEDIELLLRLPPDAGNIKADASQFEQVLMNLAVNARDAMPRGGKLVIEASPVQLDETYVRQHVGSTAGSYVLLSVSDTGTGMDAYTLARIFEPFFTTKPKGKGTGLGLSTVYGIVKQNGGYIMPYSEPGRGTTFKIYLPRVDQLGEPVTCRPAEGEPPGGTETILIAEDEESLRALARELLQAAGYRALDAGSGEEAIQLAQSAPAHIDLLLTDVVMPGMNGRELAGRLASMCPGLRVLYMSGYTDDIIASHGLLHPSNILLPKPFSRAILLRKVREALDQPVPDQVLPRQSQK